MTYRRLLVWHLLSCVRYQENSSFFIGGFPGGGRGSGCVRRFKFVVGKLTRQEGLMLLWRYCFLLFNFRPSSFVADFRASGPECPSVPNTFPSSIVFGWEQIKSCSRPGPLPHQLGAGFQRDGRENSSRGKPSVFGSVFRSERSNSGPIIWICVLGPRTVPMRA